MDIMNRRRSGVILHVTSLPSPYGIGDLGPEAYRFADFLSRSGQSCWQFLPLAPTQEISGNSPYSCVSAFAGNVLLISPDLLHQRGLITEGELRSSPAFPEGRCDYKAVAAHRQGLLAGACGRAASDKEIRDGYDRFRAEHSSWLDDFALFMVLKNKCREKSWSDWGEDVRERNGAALERVKRENAAEIEKEKMQQYLFFSQWHSLKTYCNEKGIILIGDIPIYVSHDSADAWADSAIFKLDGDRRPAFMAGVPPDYFSKTGQLWGNPVYDWDRLRETGFDWWIRRMEHSLRLFDVVRIDHFRGLVSSWEVPAGEDTAINGRWTAVPAEEFFGALLKSFPGLPLIAEDLGLITDEVREIMHRFGFPGMRVLLFAFGEDNPNHPYLPHSYVRNCIAYTGTHDNNTVRGWIDGEAGPDEKRRLFRYLGRKVRSDRLYLELIRLLMLSTANTVIFPMQDMLGLGKASRMNCPGCGGDNWQWRLVPGQLSSGVEELFGEMSRTYGRAG